MEENARLDLGMYVGRDGNKVWLKIDEKGLITFSIQYRSKLIKWDFWRQNLDVEKRGKYKYWKAKFDSDSTCSFVAERHSPRTTLGIRVGKLSNKKFPIIPGVADLLGIELES